MDPKKVVISGMLAAIFIPFVLLTDIYPFFRFGMFAEKVRYPKQMEVFALRYIDTQKHMQLADDTKMGFTNLSYLLRNYYYRNQAKQLLQNIHQLYSGNEQVREWQLLKITTITAPPYRSDTMVVERMNPQ